MIISSLFLFRVEEIWRAFERLGETGESPSDRVAGSRSGLLVLWTDRPALPGAIESPFSICFKSAFTAVSSCVSRPVYHSPAGRATAISTGRGCISSDCPSSA